MAGDIFVISDLHIGDGGPRDNFGFHDSTRPAEINAFLDFVEKEGGELIIVGDLLEFWQSSPSTVIVHNRPLLDRLAALKATHILGNHDNDLAAFIGTDFLAHPFFSGMVDATSKPYLKSIGDKTFKFMHGHEVDPFNAGDAPGWGRMMAIFAGICEDKVGSPMLGNDPLESLLTRLGEWVLKQVANGYASAKGAVTKSTRAEMTPSQNPDRAAEMLQRYAADRDGSRGTDNEYDVLIVGHTHQPGRIGDWYYNTGSWATTNNNFLRISPAGEVSLYDWVDGQPVVNEELLELPTSSSYRATATNGVVLEVAHGR